MKAPTENFITIIGTYKLHPDDAPAFAKIAAELATVARGKTGCLYYTTAADIDTVGLFYLAEEWADAAALKAHMESDYFRKIAGPAFELRIEDRNVHTMKSADRKPLPS